MSYQFGEHAYEDNHPAWQRILQKAYQQKVRPLCQCVSIDNAPMMYIACINGNYVLKRMPNTGADHAPHCDHYEPPPELSGLGQVNGTAIRDEPESQTTTLSLDFPLTKGKGKSSTSGSEAENDSVRADGTKLTLRAFAHYLWDQASLTRWSPAMTGKRSWNVVRREIKTAINNKKTKGKALSELVFIPEIFHPDKANELKSKHHVELSRLMSSTNERMIILGEYKEIEKHRFGAAVIIKHLPHIKFFINDKFEAHIKKKFQQTFELTNKSDHIILIGTISCSAQGVFYLESAHLFNCSMHWIPYENSYESELLNKLHLEGRRYVKGLRYNLPASKGLASAVLTDTGDKSTALFIQSGQTAADVDSIIDKTDNEGHLLTWKWSISGAIPDLPTPKILVKKNVLTNND